jgi:Glycosyl hydrolase family 26
VRTPASLIAYLDSIAGKHTISGQFIEFGPLDPIVAIYNNTGKWLGLIGGDYWWYGETDFEGTHQWNSIAIQYWNNNGLVELSCSMPNPTTGGPLYDLSALNATDLLTSGTTTNTNLMTILNSIGAGTLQSSCFLYFLVFYLLSTVTFYCFIYFLLFSLLSMFSLLSTVFFTFY